ncbi:type III pantothenate kinase [Novilysobacter antarcticus]|uniref:type III pantothenate kinase n=1 Tax=Novilysobacter antarcticus TaxID=2862543 RepID=UPI001C9946AE|nr:type III pantothenate kinase [Lysobacter antarcticus]
MQRWVLDLGNTRLKVAPLDVHGQVGDCVALEHRGADMATLAAQLPSQMDVAYLASVVDEGLRVALLDVLAQRCQRISVARTQRRWGDLRIAYADPARLGVDRFLAMLAANAHARRAEQVPPVLVCGVGTALTLDLIDAAGLHLGGRIAPSPTTMRHVLNQQVAQLPARGGSYVEFADDTPDALASGCVGAALGLIQRSLTEAESRVGTTVTLYLHGGGGDELRTLIPQARWAPGLVLEGLAQWAAIDDPS